MADIICISQGQSTIWRRSWVFLGYGLDRNDLRGEHNLEETYNQQWTSRLERFVVSVDEKKFEGSLLIECKISVKWHTVRQRST